MEIEQKKISQRFPEEFSKLLGELKFYAKAKKGYKVNLYDNTFCSATSYASRLSRTISNWLHPTEEESSDKMILHLNEIVSKCTQVPVKYEDNPKIIETFYDALGPFILGIENLISTYEYHSGISSKLECIIAEVKILQDT